MKISASIIAAVLLLASQTAHAQNIVLAGFARDTGIMDPTFGNKGTVTTPVPGISVSSAALDNKQNIIVAGTLNGQIALARYTAAGYLDRTFGPNHGIVLSNFRTGASGKAVAVTSGDEIVVAGKVGDRFAITRFQSDGGQIFATCASPSDWLGEANAITIDSNGRFLVAGQSAPDAKGNTNVVVARFTPDGCPDFSWGGSGLIPADFFSTNIYPGLLTKSQDARQIGINKAGLIEVLERATWTDSNGSHTGFVVNQYLDSGHLSWSWGLNDFHDPNIGLYDPNVTPPDHVFIADALILDATDYPILGHFTNEEKMTLLWMMYTGGYKFIPYADVFSPPLRPDPTLWSHSAEVRSLIVTSRPPALGFPVTGYLAAGVADGGFAMAMFVKGSTQLDGRFGSDTAAGYPGTTTLHLPMDCSYSLKAAAALIQSPSPSRIVMVGQIAENPWCPILK